MQIENNSEFISPPSPAPSGSCPICDKKVEGTGWFETTTYPTKDSIETHCAHPDCVWEKVKEAKSTPDVDLLFKKITQSIETEVKKQGGEAKSDSQFTKAVTFLSELLFPITFIISGIFNFFKASKPFNIHLKIPVNSKIMDNIVINITDSNTRIGFNKGEKFGIVGHN